MFIQLASFVTLLVLCSAQKLPVTVYYESLCPDSAKFIVEQLHPLKINNALGQRFDVTLIPFGKASYTTQGSDVIFTCQHGPNECEGNKVHACALEHIQVNSYQNKYTRETLILEYVNCLMREANLNREAPFPGKKCAQLFELNNWEVIEQCANTTEGSKLLQHHGELTNQLKPALTSVPTVTLKYQYTQENQDLAVRDLKAAICRSLPEPHPQECHGHSGGAAITTSLATFVSIGVFMLLAKLL